MAEMPPITGGGRWTSLIVLVILGFLQASAAALAAFATRSLFQGMDLATPPVTPLAHLAVAGGVTLVVAVFAKAVATDLGHSYARDLRLVLYQSAAREPISALSRRRPGAASLRFVGDLGAIRGWIGKGLAEAITSATVLPASLIVLWVVNPAFLPIGLAMIVGVVFATAIANWKFRELQSGLRKARSRMAADLSERLRQAPRLDLLGRRDKDLRLIRTHSERVRTLSVSRALRQAWLGALPDFSAALAGVACASVALRTDLPAADLAAALAVLGLVLAPLRSLATLTGRHAAYSVARRACLAALSRPSRHFPKPKEAGAPSALKRKAALSIVGLKETVQVGRGDRCVVSGDGATALYAALVGEVESDPGRIWLGSRDLATLSQGRRRGAVHIADMNSPILRGSLRRALTLGLSQRPDDAVLLQSLDRYDLVDAAPGGLDTRVDEDGQSLTASQRAALRLARASLSGTSVILVRDADHFATVAGADRLEAFLLDAAGAVLFDAPVGFDLPTLDMPLPDPTSQTAAPRGAQNNNGEPFD